MEQQISLSFFRSNTKITGKPLFFLFLLSLFILAAYYNLPRTFYQQEEWIGVGYAMANGFQAFIPRYSFAQILIGQGRVVAAPINYIFYYYFPLNVLPFVIFAIIFHILNSFLVFVLTYQLSKNSFLAKISALFFAVASVGDQAVSWPATTTTTLPAAFFSFLSLCLYVCFIETRQKRQLYFSLVFVIFAFLFKESSIFIFLIFPIIYLLFSKTKFSLVDIFKIHFPFLLYLMAMVGVRLAGTYFDTHPTEIYMSASSITWYKLAFRLIFYPLESLSQIFIHGSILYPLADIFGRSNYYRIWGTAGAPVVMETIASDMLSLFFSFIILGVTAIIYNIEKNLRKISLFAIAFTLFSFIPYIFIDKPTAFIESRHFYMSVAGGGILLALFFYSIRSFLVKKLHLSFYRSSILVLCTLLLFLVVQINYIHKDINAQVLLATERKKFLASLHELYPTIPKNPIFYFTSDHDYYIPGNKVPFQHGFGYSLMVLYFKTGMIPKELLTLEYLWIMPEQGYKEVGGKGFGYFWELDKVKKTVLEKKLDINSIVAARYRVSDMTLIDITQDVRREVAASLSTIYTQ